MILLWLIVVLLAGGLFAALAARSHPLLCRWIALSSVSLDLVLVLVMAVRDFGFGRAGTSQWIEHSIPPRTGWP
jgi:NADH:ubiquinone oxidoreductase subunit 4 (subunit M)